MTTKSERNVWVAYDFETTSINPYTCKILGVGCVKFDIRTGRHLERIYDSPGGKAFKDVMHFIRTLPGVAHNAAYDQHVYFHETGALPNFSSHDTMLMAKYWNNLLPAYDLKSLSWYFFGEPYFELLEMKNWLREQGQAAGDDEYTIDFAQVPHEMLGRYCLKDCEVTARLATWFWNEGGMSESFAYDQDRRNLYNTIMLEERGMAVNLDFCHDYLRRAIRRIKTNRGKAADRMGADGNPMGDALRDHVAGLGEKKRTPTGKTQTDVATIRKYKGKDLAIGSVLRVRKDEKLANTYITNMLQACVEISPGVGLFHPGLMQSGAVTRRYRARGFFSDKEGVITRGNTQNFPKEVREAIIARLGYHLYKIDLASIEARMFSSFMEILIGFKDFAERYRQDPWFNVYLHIIEKCTGHGKVSKKHPLYTPYKHVSLARLYGSGVKRTTIQLNDDFELDYTEGEVEEIRDSIDRHCPFIRDTQRYLSALASEQGYLDDPFGARFYIPQEEVFKSVAYLCQGCAGNVLKWWWCEINRDMAHADDHVVNTVHDELVFEMSKKGGTHKRRAKRYADVLKNLDIFDLPIRAEVEGPLKHWGE